MFAAHRVEGIIPLELPGGRSVMAGFELSITGDMTLRFTDDETVNSIMGEAVRNNLVMLNLSYAAALPAEPDSAVVTPANDLVRLQEDVRGHALKYDVAQHTDGRLCGYHVRLHAYTPDGLNECTRLHTKNPGE